MMDEAMIQSPGENLTKKPNNRKKENLKQRAYLNSLTSIIDYAGGQITGFIVSPFIVSGLGSSLYGIWQILCQMTGYVNIADTRATQVLKWSVAKKKDVVNEEELRSDVSSAFAVTLFLIPIALVAGSIISWYAPVITHADKAYYNLIRITCSIMIFSLVIAKFFDLFESVLRGMNLGYKRMGLRAGIVALGGGLKVYVITQGFGLIGLSIVQLVISFIIGISFYTVVKKNVSWFGFGKTNRARILQFTKLSGWYFADAGANILKSHSDKILLGFLIGPVMVSYYSLTMFLPAAFQGFTSNLVQGVMPGIGKLYGLKEYEKINRVRGTLQSITFLLSTAAGVTIIFLNNSFLTVWVGNGYFVGNLANMLIMLMVIQNTFINQDGYIISTTLDLKKKVFLSLISGLLFIILAFILIKKFEIIGLCVSLILSKFWLYLGQQNIIRNKFHSNHSMPAVLKIQPLLIALIMLGIAGLISRSLPLFSTKELLILAPTIFILSALLYYGLGFRRETRREMLQMIATIDFIKSKKGNKSS